jgi:GTP-binding protein Era
VQLAFYDTPGFVSKNDTKKLDSKTLQSIVKSSTSKADVVLIVVDSAKSLTANFMHTFGEMVKIGLDCAKIEIILVLNKVDLVEPKTKLLEITRKLVSLINGIKLGPKGRNRAVLDNTTFMIDALNNDGVVDVKNYLLTLAKYKPWVIPKGGGVTNLSEDERIEQIILEALLEHTHEEIPYIAEISCVSIKPNPKYIEIKANIFVDSVNQRRIVIGQQARTLVKVRTAAVEVLEEILKKNVILYLDVKLRSEDGESGGGDGGGSDDVELEESGADRAQIR